MTTSGARSAIRLSPLEVPKASDALANELRERILSGEFVEGTPLPPERELVVQTRMSRSTVREALRILEVQGLIRIKAGRAGGAFVQQPGDLARLEAANDALAASGSLEDFLRANVEWHVAVATAGHNENLTGVMMAMTRAIYTATNNESFVDDVRAIALRAHRSVTRAIKERDPDAAVRRMERHVHAYAAAALQADDRTAISLDASD